MKLFNNKKGFTLLEMLIVMGIIIALVAMTYSYMLKKQVAAKAQTQVMEILQMDESVQQMMINVSTDNTLGVAKIIDMLTPAKLIEAKMAPSSRVAGTEIRNAFKSGNITFTSEALNVSNINTRVVPIYSYIITEIPPQACSVIVSHVDLQKFLRIRVDGVTVKNVGEVISPSQAASACSGSVNKTIEIAQSSVVNKNDYGTAIVNLTGTAGNIRVTENPLYQEQLQTTSNVGACSGGSWNNTLSYCSCPIGTEWNGQSCIAYGQPGKCPGGQGWNIATQTCIPLLKLPFADNAQHYDNGRYVPNYAENPLGMPVGLGLFACDGPLPPNATPPSNVNGTYDNSICNKCINGTWNGSRCVLPYVAN